ncbi:hypothetical protein [Anaerocolumna xylanovorans]|uniref:Uncharacterized protein n=1 Tax=Anaerocolumna xylanovorans DSM 12503 TaxID=1121345 RepID=A0A1M7YNQ9_9FIRM|nr:hypothetical protein [Anaerocolumna xylanovorans]SHO54136.1 hypothetical protein SAMN02745217_04591 [Anaerocolumna xylanovorans DSM 12503]
MTVNTKNTIYEGLPAVTALNKIQGFDPKKFLRRAVSERTGQEVLYLDLKYKKLWFRLACPKGRIKMTALKITEQLAIIEAKIFFDKNDKEPAASFIAQRNAKDTPGSLYIEAAQYAAVDQALIDAGFGLQFCDVTLGSDAELLDDGIPLSATSKVPEVTAAQLPVQVNSIQEDPSPVIVPTEPVKPVTPAVVQEPVVQIQKQPAESAMESTTVQEDSPVTEQTEILQEARAAEATMQPTTLVQSTAPVQPESIVETVQIHASVPEDSAVESTVESGQDFLPYTSDMAVEDICRLMTLKEASAIIVDVGTCNGWTLEQVAQRRAASLKWYLNGYTGDNNILRAGARLLLEREQAKLAS